MRQIISRLFLFFFVFVLLVEGSTSLLRKNSNDPASLSQNKNTCFAAAFYSSSESESDSYVEAQTDSESKGGKGVVAEESLESDDDDDESSGDNEFFTSKMPQILSAWQAASKIPGRDPELWRMDPKKNIIICRRLFGNPSCPVGFLALVKGLEENAVHFEAVQSEYYGAEDEDNHKSALKYKEMNPEFDSVLSLIEIALNGYVSGDSNGDSVCWTPSQVHQDLFSRDHYARLWHRRVKKDHSSYGKAGHFMVFGPMNVSLKDVGQFTEEQLKALDPKNDFLYIHNYQLECSDYVGPVTDARYADSDAKRKEEINRNWGLPVVASFVEESPVVIAASNPKFARPIPKSLKLNEENFPSLGTVSTKSKGGQLQK